MRASFAEEKDKNLYSRFSNPNVTESIDKIKLMEGAEAGYAFATGMASNLFHFCGTFKCGRSHCELPICIRFYAYVVTKYFPKWNINTTYFKAEKSETIEDLIQTNTKILYLERQPIPQLKCWIWKRWEKLPKSTT